MNCPKCKHSPLLDSTLSGNLAVNSCQDCQGSWIRANDYENWHQQSVSGEAELFSQIHHLDYVPSPLDNKAALCPDCQRILSRAKVSLKTSFYIERCSSCNGIWCDGGEWEVLEKLGWHTHIEQLFTASWQARMREYQHAEQERQAIVDKVGYEIAAQVFELAAILEKHPNGDFAAAYLMRRCEKDKTSFLNQPNL